MHELHDRASIRVVVAEANAGFLLDDMGVRWLLVVAMQGGVVVPVLVVVVRVWFGVEEQTVSRRRVLQMVASLRVDVVLRVQRIRPQHRPSPRLPHRRQDLLLVHPPGHRHLLPHHVYVYAVHPCNTSSLQHDHLTRAMNSMR